MRRPLLVVTLFRLAARLLARLLLRVRVSGQDQVPRGGALLITLNHLGGADSALMLGFVPRPLAAIGKSEILGWPVLGFLARVYGMVPVRRGQPDRSALRLALAILAEGRALAIAPEGRESLTGALEAAKTGPAFLAQQSGAPILPAALTGTAWKRIVPQWRRLRRPCVTLTFGRPYHLPPGLTRRAAADYMMRQIAALLPEEYRGVYAGSAGEPA
jgi:1-acyl-sn-glycerol-3-phosphate acyltransferase